MSDLDKLQLRVSRVKHNLRCWIDFHKILERNTANDSIRGVISDFRQILENTLADLEGNDD